MLLEIQVRLLRHVDMLITTDIKEYSDSVGPKTWLVLIMFSFCQGELINNIEKNVTSAAEYVEMSKAETHKAVTYKKNPYKIVSLPSFLKRRATAKTATDQNTSDLNHDWAPEPVWTATAPKHPDQHQSLCSVELHFSSGLWYSACLKRLLQDNEEAVIFN